MEKLLRPIIRWDCRALAKNFTFIEDPVDYLMRESYRHYSLDQRDQLTTLVHLIGHTSYVHILARRLLALMQSLSTTSVILFLPLLESLPRGTTILPLE